MERNQKDVASRHKTMHIVMANYKKKKFEPIK